MYSKKVYGAENEAVKCDRFSAYGLFVIPQTYRILSHPLPLSVKKYINKRYLLIEWEWLKKKVPLQRNYAPLSLFLLGLKRTVKITFCQ